MSADTHSRSADDLALNEAQQSAYPVLKTERTQRSVKVIRRVA